jgi:hypothetical protein
VFSTAGFLWQRFTAGPLAFASEISAITSGMFHVPGGSWLEEHGHARALWQASLMKAHALVGGDLVFVGVALLAPIGLAVGRARRPIAIIGLWVGVHLFFTAISGYGGQRFRQPIDVALFALATAAVAGHWRPGWWRWLVVAVLAAPIVFGIAASGRESIGARSDYGVLEWRVIEGGRAADVRAESGFNLTPPGRAVELIVTSADAQPVRISVNGYEVARTGASAAPQVVAVPHAGGRVFVEVASDRSGPGTGTVLTITMRGGR